MPFICVKCRADMICDKNSVGIDYGHGHVYPGDRHKCQNCGIAIISTNKASIHDPNYDTQDEYLISNQNQTLQWYAYKHQNQTHHLKRFLGDYGDITEADQSPFVEKVIGPFGAPTREIALKIMKRLLT